MLVINGILFIGCLITLCFGFAWDNAWLVCFPAFTIITIINEIIEYYVKDEF